MLDRGLPSDTDYHYQSEMDYYHCRQITTSSKRAAKVIWNGSDDEDLSSSSVHITYTFFNGNFLIMFKVEKKVNMGIEV